MPVINPMVFYLMSVADTLKDFLFFVGVGMLILPVVYAIGISNNEDDFLRACRRVKKIWVIGMAILTIRIFIPSTATVEKMVIAQNVTYERVEQATDVVADVYNDIMDLFKQDDQKK